MNSRKFVLVYACIVGGFFFLNLIFWHTFVKPTFITQDSHGDLSRLGMYVSNKSQTPPKQYPGKRILFSEYMTLEQKPKIDIITIGDSFFNGCHYQEYLTSQYKKTVLHVDSSGHDCVTMLRMMEESGYLKEIAPNTVILESVERSMQNRFGKGEIQSICISKESFAKTQIKKDSKSQSNAETNWAPGLMMTANLKFIQNKLRYFSNDNRLSDEVYIEKLTRPMFTNPAQEKTLLFYHDDLWYMKENANYDQINKTLNDLADDLSSQGIRLVFMTCVDKFDLYYPYIQDKELFPENHFFEEFEVYPKHYIFINTKQILREMLAEGEKDIYWFDDTHWSWKAQQRVADDMIEKLD